MIANRSMPASTVIPVLAYNDVAAAVDWLCLTLRLQGALARREPPGSARSRRRGSRRDRTARRGLGEPRLPLRDGAGRGRGQPPRAGRERGARILDPPADQPYGERQYTAEDTGGHRWTFSQSIADVVPEEWGGASADI